jgi:hypothetical protein
VWNPIFIVGSGLVVLGSLFEAAPGAVEAACAFAVAERRPGVAAIRAAPFIKRRRVVWGEAIMLVQSKPVFTGPVNLQAGRQSARGLGPTSPALRIPSH